MQCPGTHLRLFILSSFRWGRLSYSCRKWSRKVLQILWLSNACRKIPKRSELIILLSLQRWVSTFWRLFWVFYQACHQIPCRETQLFCWCCHVTGHFSTSLHKLTSAPSLLYLSFSNPSHSAELNVFQPYQVNFEKAKCKYRPEYCHLYYEAKASLVNWYHLIAFPSEFNA